jgi:hypothetical protein
MTHDEMLLWLNDHCDSHVTAELQLEREGHSIAVLSVGGVLRHWSEIKPGSAARRLQSGLGDELKGLYQVGDDPTSAIDVSDLGGHDAQINAGGELIVELSGDTRLRVVATSDSP